MEIRGTCLAVFVLSPVGVQWFPLVGILLIGLLAEGGALLVWKSTLALPSASHVVIIVVVVSLVLVPATTTVPIHSVHVVHLVVPHVVVESVVPTLVHVTAVAHWVWKLVVALVPVAIHHRIKAWHTHHVRCIGHGHHGVCLHGHANWHVCVSTRLEHLLHIGLEVLDEFQLTSPLHLEPAAVVPSAGALLLELWEVGSQSAALCAS